MERKTNSQCETVAVILWEHTIGKLTVNEVIKELNDFIPAFRKIILNEEIG